MSRNFQFPTRLVRGPSLGRTSNFKNFSAGFTLIEVTVAIFGFSLIIWGLVGLVSGLLTSSGQQAGLLSDQDQARRLAFAMATELRNGQTGSSGAYTLDTAGAQQLIYYSNADLDPGVERIRYFVQNGKLWKGVTEYNGSSYDLSKEQTIAVQNNLANGAAAVFYYYDGSYSGSSTQAALSQPVNVTQVKFVKISLQVFNKAGVKNTNTYTITAGAAIRNLKTNLAN